MRHSIAVKFILILLTALCLVSAVAGTVGICVMTVKDMYSTDISQQYEDWLYHAGYVLARHTAQQYASEELGGCPQEIIDTQWDHLNYESYDYNYTDSNWQLTLMLDGETLVETGASEVEDGYTLVYEIQTGYLVASREDNGTDWYQSVYEDGEWVTYWLEYEESPPYTACLHMNVSVLEGSEYKLLEAMYAYRYTFIWALVISLVLTAAGVVVLCQCAGHNADGTVRPGGLNRLPLDLYIFVDFWIIVLMTLLCRELLQWSGSDIHIGTISLLALMALVAAVVIVGYIFALAAQVKAKKGFWWRHSAIGFCLMRLWDLLKLLWRGLRWLSRALGALIRHWPIMGQWLAASYGCLGVSIITLFLGLASRGDGAAFWGLICALSLFVAAAVALYNGWCFGVILRGAQEMASGQLQRKIPTQHLYGIFLDFALQMNSLSEAATLAAQKQMKSERMKSELITNVSHDIKTPLTSIINFVDLLQKPHTQEEEKEYLEVLSRQSARMKKLIEDLMEMSKANTGNMAVSPVKLDAVETINQALGEFSDKLEQAHLNPIFRQPEAPVYIQADGRLTWRVLSNVLSNAVKYALPGTRLYIDLTELEGEVLLSVKNISREELRLTADELMERFVQGDASRNTEGSGLGLNIARSLMEVQHGQLNLLLDGDLFKVTLIFPGAK